MSTFISSAVAGKKAAPKAPARRRPGPPAPPKAPLPTPPTTQEESTPNGAETNGESTVANVEKETPAVGEVAQSNAAANQPQPSVEDSARPVEVPPVATETSITPANVTPTPGPQSQPNIQPLSSQAIAETQTNSEPEVSQPPHTSQSSYPESTSQPTQSRPQPADSSPQPSPAPEPRSQPSTLKRSADQQPSQRSQPPAKKVKRSSTRTNAKLQAIANNEEVAGTRETRASTQEQATEDDELETGPPRRVTRARAQAIASGDEADRSSPTKKRRRSRHDEEATSEHSVNQSEEDEDEEVTERPKKRRKRRKAKRREGEEVEEDEDVSDPESKVIDAKALTMAEVTYYSKFGKVSERERKMREINWGDVKRKKREEGDRIALGQDAPTKDGVVESVEREDGEQGEAEATVEGAAEEDAATNNAQENDEEEEANEGPGGGVQFRVVNGQLVADEDTLAVDRQAEAEANALDLATVEEENDLSVMINRTHRINQRKRDPRERVPYGRNRSTWTEQETERFFEVLPTYGTDFNTISYLLPGKSRAQVKAKFVREEKLNPDRINAALLGKTPPPIDLCTYATETGRDISAFTKYDSIEQATLKIREEYKEKEEQLLRAEEERRENDRQEEIQRKAREKANAEKKGTGKRGRKGKKGMGMGTLGGGQDDGGGGGDA